MSRDMYGDIEKDTNVGDILSNTKRKKKQTLGFLLPFLLMCFINACKLGLH